MVWVLVGECYMSKKRVYPRKGEILMMVYDNGKHKAIFKILSSRKLPEPYWRDKRKKYEDRCLYKTKCLYSTHNSRYGREYEPDGEYELDVFLDKEYCEKTFATSWWEQVSPGLLDKIMVEML
jgi:hypothetical protein